MNHRRMIRYRRHRGYGASALSFVTACWNGLWKETLFSVSSVSSVVSLLLCLFFLSSCHYARPNLSSEEMPQKTKDSLNYLYERHYTWNTNLELTADSILLECLPIKDTYINLYRGDRVVVAEFAVHPADSVDSVWVKLAHTQDEQGWIREVELKRSFVPTDSISQAIHLFSDTHASYFVVIFALFVGVYLLRPMGRAMLNICIVFAQLERETIQKRVTDAYYSRCLKGFHMSGQAPYGFALEPTVVENIRTKMMVADPIAASHVRLMFEMYAEPETSFGDITRYFEERGRM